MLLQPVGDAGLRHRLVAPVARRRPGRGPAACSGRRRRSPPPRAAPPPSRPSPGSRSARRAAGRSCRHIRSYARRSAARRSRRAGRAFSCSRKRGEAGFVGRHGKIRRVSVDYGGLDSQLANSASHRLRHRKSRMTELPPPRPAPSRAPTATNATATRSRTPMPGCATRAIPRSRTRTCSPISRPRTPISKRRWRRTRPLVETLFEEMKGRIKEDESSVPVRDGDWLYWWAFEPGAQYRSWYRRPVAGRRRPADLRRAGRSRGQGIFPPRRARDQPRRPARRHPVDDDGSERFDLRIRDLATGEDVETVTDVGIGHPVWTERQPRHRLHRGQRAIGAATARATTGSASRSSEDVTLYEETEELGFSVGVSRSQDRSLIFIATGDNATSEVRFVPAGRPASAARP